MGIDWFRMKPKATVDHGRLCALIERQAHAFQSNPFYWTTDPIDWPRDFFDAEEAEHGPVYLESSRALQDLLEFPRYDQTTDACDDHADLAACWRTYFITCNDLFPPAWRLQAHRTILPEELPGWLSRWRSWIEQVRNGKHQDYLFRLWRYDTLLFLRHHCEALHQAATLSLEKTNAWTKKPKFLDAREQALNYPCPATVPAPALDPLEFHYTGACSAEVEEAVARRIADLIRVTRNWDAAVHKGWKVGYYERYYRSFEEYLKQIEDDWLTESLDWVQRCCELGFGLFLDY